MKKNTLKQSMLAVLLGTALLLPGCGADDKNVAEKDTTEYTEAKSTQIADASEMAETVEVVDENMVPIHADQLLEGTYPIAVDSSSTMFRIVSGELKVEAGQMFVTMTMGGTGYRYLFMGTGEQAVEAGEEQYIPFVENTSGEHTFTVPVEALDAGIDCAAFSNNKEKWYDRTVVFRADTLPADAFAEGYFVDAKSLGLEDGTYTVEVTEETVAITIPDGVTVSEVVVSPNTAKVTGIPENATVKLAVSWDGGSEQYAIVKVDATTGAVTLDEDATVTVGTEKIPLKPAPSDAGDEVAPLEVGEGVSVGIKSIPGLVYRLARGTTPDGVDTTAENAVVTTTATSSRVSLTDPQLPSDVAFYRVTVDVK